MSLVRLWLPSHTFFRRTSRTHHRIATFALLLDNLSQSKDTTASSHRFQRYLIYHPSRQARKTGRTHNHYLIQKKTSHEYKRSSNCQNRLQAVPNASPGIFSGSYRPSQQWCKLWSARCTQCHCKGKWMSLTMSFIDVSDTISSFVFYCLIVLLFRMTPIEMTWHIHWQWPRMK